MREPAAAGAPAFLFGAVEFAAIAALLRERPDLGPEGLAVLLGINPAATVAERDDGAERVLLVTGGELRGAWAPDVAATPPMPAPPPTFAPSVGAGLEAAPPPQQHQGQQQSAEPPPPGDAVLRRTPHLDAPDPLPAQAGAEFTVRVWTDEAPARLGEEAEDVIVEAPPDVASVELGVLLVTGAHLEVAGAYFQPLTIERDRPDSVPVDFTVRVVDPDAPGDPELVAQFMFRGRPCGRIRRRWQFPDGASVPTEATPAGVPVHTDARAVDLTVLITATGGGSAYTCSVHAPGVPGFEVPTPAVEWPLAEAADAMIARALAKLVDRGTPDPERKLALKAAGRTFWNAAPAAFRAALWALHDQRAGAPGRASVYVASDEPLLPWEIMLPSRPRPGAPDEDLGAPLGAAFAVGRWVRGDASSPPQLLPVRDAFLIAPSTTSPSSSSTRARSSRCWSSTSAASGSNSRTSPGSTRSCRGTPPRCCTSSATAPPRATTPSSSSRTSRPARPPSCASPRGSAPPARNGCRSCSSTRATRAAATSRSGRAAPASRPCSASSARARSSRRCGR